MLKNKKIFSLIAISVFVVAIVTGAFTWKANVSSGITSDEVFKQQIRNGLAEISLPTNNNATAINAATDNLANFIYYRSGIQISQTNKNLLKTSEQGARNQSKSITPSQLSQILTDVVNERISTLTNAEISNATENLRGFNAPDLPAGFQQGRSFVKLRTNGDGTMSATTFQNEVTNIRNTGIDRAMRSAISSRITLEVERKVSLLSDASSEYFSEAQTKLTPMQAFLIIYSIATDDPLAYNQAGLQQRMQNVQQGISQAIGQSYSSPQNHRAYGENGYLYSSPSSLALNDASITTVINLINERGNIQ